MRILIINQYFPPDRAATGILLGQLAEDLAGEFHVTIVCGSPTYAPEKSSSAQTKSLRIIRIPLIRGSRSNLLIRGLNYFLFMLGARIRTFLLRPHDVVLCWTDPPVVGMLGVGSKILQRSKFIFVSQDVYPEVAILMKRANSFLSQAILQHTNRMILRSADAVVAVGREMQERLIEKGCKEEKIHLIPNWHDLETLQPTSGTKFRHQHQISKNAFVVMHSGNVGFSQDFDTLLETAANTLSDPEIIYLIVGDGGREKELQNEVKKRRLSNVRFLPYQPSKGLAETLSAADLHYVSLLPELTGYIVPSKIYGILSVARPILANVEEKTEVAHIVKSAACGFLSEPNAALLAQTILEAKNDPEQLRQMGQSGRRWMEQFGGRTKATSTYANLIRKVMNQ